MSISHGGQIVTDGLVLALDAGDFRSYPGADTIWYDTSGNGYNHYLKVATTPTSLITTFDGVTCMDFSGGSKWADPISSTFVLPTTGYTYCAWANVLSDAQVSTWRTMFRSTPDDHPFLIADGSSLLGMYDNNGGGFLSTGYTVTQVNTWNMFTVIGQSDSTTDFYIDTTFVGSSSDNAGGNSHDAIGAAGGGSQNIGYIATTSAYTKALSAEEIYQNYNATKGRFT